MHSKQIKRVRRMILLGMLVFPFSRFLKLQVYGQETATTTIEWRIPREQVKTVTEQLTFTGEITGDPATVEDTKGLPLVYILVGAVALAELAKILLEVYRDIKYGGIVIRSENGKIQIENKPEISSGTIIIQEKDTVKVIFQEKDKPQILDLVKAIEVISKK